MDKIDFSKYIDIINFNVANFERYEAYYKEHDYDLKTTVTYVNLNLDKDYYTDTKEAEDPSAIQVLVNKFYYLSEDYVPENLVTLFDNSNAKLVEKADTYSARPGFSEHQAGLVVDLNDPNVSGQRLNDEDYTWLQNNAYKYGFIIRYTADNEFITGYIEEPWHLRYLGVELATKVYESGLTYDEYYDLYLTEY